MRPKNHEKRFKFRKRAGHHGCMMCHGFNMKSYNQRRPMRNIALKKGNYDEALDRYFVIVQTEHNKGGKSDRNANRTFWHNTYQLWREWKNKID